MAMMENLVSNGGFEEGSVTSIEGWQTATFIGEAEFSRAENGRSGYCAKVTSEDGADAGWTFTVPVEPESIYRLSGYIRTENMRTNGGFGAVLNVHTVENARTAPVIGADDWQYVEVDFRSGNRQSVQVNCLLGGWGTVTGTAYFDDISVVKLEAPTGRVMVDVTKKLKPANELLYSQFIEHLGRCIYGGIWAEMLEDRKFYYDFDRKPAWRPIVRGAETQDPPFDVLIGSPWEVVGEASQMKKVKSAWRHDPVLELSAVSGGPVGLKQSRLGTVAGRGLDVALSVKGKGVFDVWVETSEGRTSTTLTVDHQEFDRGTLKLMPKGDSDDATFGFELKSGSVQVAAASVMPENNVNGFRADTLALLKELDAPMYRWPGGNFVSGYEWRDGIGDPDKRPTFRNPAWSGIDTNDVGTHEFIEFCRLIDTEPLIVANTGFGDPYSAGLWVEYCNGAATTPQGQIRARNGQREPFDIKWWGVGNEMFGTWQLGYMAVNQYAIKHEWTVDRMLRVDPDLTLIGVGEQGNNFSVEMLRRTRDTMDYLSEHLYCQNRDDVRDHVRQMIDKIRVISDKHRAYRKALPNVAEDPIMVSLDEWNYWYGPHLYGELGTAYSLKDALGIAAGLHQLYRDSDVYEIAMYAQTVNVIGCIKTTKTDAWMETTGKVLALYRKEMGSVPLDIENPWDVTGVDVLASLSEDGKFLTVSVVNTTSEAVTVPLRYVGVTVGDSGRVWTMTGSDPLAVNTVGEKDNVDFVESAFSGSSGELTVPALGVSLYKFPLQ